MLIKTVALSGQNIILSGGWQAAKIEPLPGPLARRAEGPAGPRAEGTAGGRRVTGVRVAGPHYARSLLQQHSYFSTVQQAAPFSCSLASWEVYTSTFATVVPGNICAWKKMFLLMKLNVIWNNYIW